MSSGLGWAGLDTSCRFPGKSSVSFFALPSVTRGPEQHLGTMVRGRLSRKLLFLSVSFTSLLLFLHLPSTPHHFAFSPTSSLCNSRLHRISWTHSPSPTWSWNKSQNCDFQRFSSGHASELLRGAWILAAGDSQARLILLALLRLLLDPAQVSNVEPDLFRRHSDYQLTLPDRGIKVDYLYVVIF